jgi:hypothetical protein
MDRKQGRHDKKKKQRGAGKKAEEEEGGGPILVNLGAKVMAISDVSSVDQRFVVDFILITSWLDPALKNTPADAKVDLAAAWHPRLNVKNAYDLEKIGQTHGRRLKDRALGLVHETHRFRGSVSTFMDLSMFPFDKQALRIIISTPKPLTAVRFVSPAISKVAVSSDIRMNEFQVLQPKWRCVTTDPAASTSGRVYSEFHLDLRVERLVTFYLLNIAFILAMIVSLSFLSFCIDCNAVGERIGITLTLLLTAVAFKMACESHIPVVAYVSLLDQYVIGSFIFLWMITIEAGVMTLLPEAVRLTADRIAAVVFILMWLLFHAAAYWRVRKFLKKNRFWHMIKTANSSSSSSSGSSSKAARKQSKFGRVGVALMKWAKEERAKQMQQQQRQQQQQLLTARATTKAAKTEATVGLRRSHRKRTPTKRRYS